MIKVLFVCLGNICRSPMAEAVFRHKVEIKGLQDAFHIDSCGTASYHIGESPDERSIKTCEDNGIESIKMHRGRQNSITFFVWMKAI
ncbi:Phosphotyrosine protein phosphatase I superfamily domain-containing protein [Rozella allomycis CSF55]|uniref:Phosphotyrosine protein phosphatase I superfamily domain-containing protein n=1 Tax=Rozella allomycis (strain CSF55) TaxID=988480 RepID=A0A075AR07_ROZAC|nr:Phosphotyrosine protein phosphatase I superfamily domain-containing protein [Rozella allomycis CSF55]|eukprot:EPZ32726.1 Phosphotyrosine protein phosphatase I superfamily domain-containing protein [Rozella allomycis CSF55]